MNQPIDLQTISEEQVWKMLTILVRLRNIYPFHPLRKAEIYREIVEVLQTIERDQP